MRNTSHLETGFISFVFYSFAKLTYEELLLDLKQQK